MNRKSYHVTHSLVQEYEAIKRRGEATYFDDDDYRDLINFYEEENQISEALAVVEEALAKYGFSLEFYLKKAQLLIANNCEDLALDILNKALLIAPEDPAIQLLKAEAFIYQGKHTEAIAIIDYLKSYSDQDGLADVLMTESLLYETEEAYECAFYAMKAVLSIRPNHKEALERIWLLVEATRKHEESIEIHENILNRDPYAHLAWYNLGHAHAYLGNYAEAVEALEFAIAVDDAFETAYRDCAEICFELKSYQKALRYFEEILEYFEPDSELFLRIGQCYQFLGRYAIARTFLTRAMHLDHLNDEVYFHIGECFAHEGKWQSAVNAYEKALNIENNHEAYYAAIGASYYQKGDLQNAEDAFKKAISLASEDVTYWVHYASFLLEAGRPAEALLAVEEASKVTSDEELIYYRIACLFALGKRQEAYYWLSEALSEHFNQHRSLFHLLPELENDPKVNNLISTYLA